MKYSKIRTPLKVGSLVRNSGNGARLMEVINILDGWATLKSYGKTDGHGGLIPSVRPRCIVKQLATKDHQQYDGSFFKAGSYCESPGPFSYYIYYHVEPV